MARQPRTSLRSRILSALLPLRGGKRRYSSAERTSRRVARMAGRPRRSTPPRLLSRRVTVRRQDRCEWPVYTLEPVPDARRAPSELPTLIYFHGGAYINEIDRAHWFLVARLVRLAPCRCLLPIYPLGASAGAARVVSTARDIAADVISELGGEQVVVAGDSAGGGLALAVTQLLRDQDCVPAHLILVSPWLDVSVSDPRQRDLERRDAMLAAAGLREAGRIYADGLAVGDPRVSPLYGELGGLPPITVFTGTRDLVNPDSHRLLERCRAAGTECELIEAHGLPHVYPLMPTPEGREARTRIVELLRQA